MDNRYALEIRINNDWVTLKNYTGLSKTKADFLMHLIASMKSTKQLRCIAQWLMIGDTHPSALKRGAFVWVLLFTTRFPLIERSINFVMTSLHQVLAKVWWNAKKRRDRWQSGEKSWTLTRPTVMRQTWVQNPNWFPWKGLTKLGNLYIVYKSLQNDMLWRLTETKQRH